MKSFIPIALSALLAVAAAVPLEKRGYTATFIEEVTETVDVYTTVYVQPGDPRLLQNPQTTLQTSSSSASTASTSAQTSSTSVYVPQQNKLAADIVQAPTSTPVPTSTPAPAPSVTPSSTPAVIAQPEVKAVAPVQSYAAPVPSSPAPSSSTSDSGATGGACGTVNGKCTASDVTTFEGAGAAGSCGWVDPVISPYYVALAKDMMGTESNGNGKTNPYCGRTLKISANGQEYEGVLTDKCADCQGQSLDLSKALFEQVFPTAGGTGRFHNIEWRFTS